MARQILHVDMDAFFAAIEQRENPALRGKPVVVGGSAEGRGVVAAASYEARPFGLRSAMPMATALRLCPQAVVVPVRHALYREVSRQVFSILDRFSPLVEPLSIDEAFVDLTAAAAGSGGDPRIARDLKQQIRNETGLTASVGLAPNKFLAKLASELCKPDGLRVIRPEEVQATLDALPVDRLWGVGAATRRRFDRLGVRTVGDVRRFSLALLRQAFGSAGDHFYRLARGEDDRPVCPDHQAKSISHEMTFARDVPDPEALRAVLLHQVEDVAHRLRRLDLQAGTMTVKIRYSDFRTITRAASLPSPSQLTEPLWRAAATAFEAWVEQNRVGKRVRPVRLIGAGAGSLSAAEGRQLSLFQEGEARQQRLEATTDALRERFGPNALRRRLPERRG